MSAFYNSLDFPLSLKGKGGGVLSENHNALRKNLAQGLLEKML